MASITGKGVSPNLVKGVRKRNGLVKEPGKKKNSGKIKSSYGHTVSVDVVREQGEHIFGFIQDKTKVVYHYLASEHNLEQAVQALKNYIKLYGKPDAVRSDNGSEFKGEFLAFLNEKGIKPMRPLPYNPGANGFIERYFRTLRKDLFRKLRANHLLVSQKCLDEFAFIKNHCSTVGKTGQTPAEMARLENNTKLPENFQFEQVSMHDWNFWHIKGIHGLMHAYVRVGKLQFDRVKSQAKICL